MALEKCCLIGRGKIYMRPVADPQVNGLLPVGNVEAINISVDENEISVQDFTTAGSSKDCSYKSIQSVKMACTMRCYTKDNLIKATYGNSNPVSTATITGEVHTVLALGSFIPFNKLPNPAVAVLVKDVTDATTYVEGTDYIIGNGGIFVTTGGDISASDVLHISYGAAASDEVQFLTNGGLEYEVVLDGVNAANNLPFFVQWYRVKFSTAKQLDFISSEFASIELDGEVLKSQTILGDSSISSYGIMRI